MKNNQNKSKLAPRMLKICGITVTILVAIIALAWLGLKKNVDPATMNESEFEHFVIYDQDCKEDVIKDIAASLEEIYIQYADVYGLSATGPVKVFLYSDQADFKRAYLGYLLSWVYRDVDWMVGGAYQDSIIMVSPDAPGNLQPYEGMLEIARHELIHVFNFHLNPAPAMFLDEGLAVLLSGQGQQESKPGAPAPDAEELKSWDAAEFGDNGGYYYAYSFCNYLVKQNGLGAVLEILRTDDYQAIIGKSFEEVYAEWAMQD